MIVFTNWYCLQNYFIKCKLLLKAYKITLFLQKLNGLLPQGFAPTKTMTRAVNLLNSNNIAEIKKLAKNITIMDNGIEICYWFMQFNSLRTRSTCMLFYSLPSTILLQVHIFIIKTEIITTQKPTKPNLKRRQTLNDSSAVDCGCLAMRMVKTARTIIGSMSSRMAHQHPTSIRSIRYISISPRPIVTTPTDNHAQGQWRWKQK